MTITYHELLAFLQKADFSFPTPLSQRVCLPTYAEKLLSKATLIIERNTDGDIIALLTGYTDCLKDNISYIPLLCVDAEYRGQGIAAKLLKQFFIICQEKNIDTIHLYTDCKNASAQHLYQKMGFVPYFIKDEPRPNDIHFIYYFR